MSVQDDKTAGEEADQQVTEKPEPDEDDKKAAAEMMTAYEDRPTLVLPGSGGAVSGTAIGAWLDDDGNPKHSDGSDGDIDQDQIEKDKKLNVELTKLAAEENKGEKRPATGGS